MREISAKTESSTVAESAVCRCEGRSQPKRGEGERRDASGAGGRLIEIERFYGESAATIRLDELREARELTQVQLAQVLQVSQGAVSKVERRADMYISTLRSYVRAIGGDLQIRAVFPEGEVVIDQFEDLDPARQRGTA